MYHVRMTICWPSPRDYSLLGSVKPFRPALLLWDHGNEARLSSNCAGAMESSCTPSSRGPGLVPAVTVAADCDVQCEEEECPHPPQEAVAVLSAGLSLQVRRNRVLGV